MERDEIYTVIKVYENDFVRDLHDDVFCHLHSNNLISDDEYNCIWSSKERENRVRTLLEILPEKGDSVFKPFISYIQVSYPWIINNEKSIEQDNHVDEVLKFGGIPPIPRRHITRNDTLMELRSLLSRLKRGKYVVVHGMRGCGKSTLVAEALNNYCLIVNEFKRNVFWLTCSMDELVLLTNLLQQCDLPLVENVADAKNSLKKKFSEERLKNSLLILDDVVSPSIISAFDIGCKILVTTHDVGIMNGASDNADYIRVRDAFTEDETLNLFKKAICSNELPYQAKRIHQICKGFPMTISLLSAQLEQYKEDVVRNQNRWDFYIKTLIDRKISDAIGRFDQKGFKAVEHLWSAIGMCIDSLDSLELKVYYEDFALFQNDVNIKPEVLVTLWGLCKKDVEDIMLQFENKSLVVRLWNQVLNSYVYSIHDLLLDYLKDQLTDKRKKELHLKLINQYEKKFGPAWRFPSDDNYILLYLGYHLKEAGSFDQFPSLYLNLRFIERKIKVNGPGDLLIDYKKYCDLICNSEKNKKKFEDCERFVNWAAIRIYQSSCDIVQFGLQEVKNSFVYTEALKISASDKKYFKFSTEPPEAPSYYHRMDEIVTAIFARVDDQVLISNATGDIKLIDVKLDQNLATYKGHTEKVIHLSLCPTIKFFFLSASDDTTVRIWSLDHTYKDKARTPSPSCRQDQWIDGWDYSRPSGEQSIMVLDKHNSPITDANFSRVNDRIVTASEDKTVRIWSFSKEQLVGDSIVAKTGSIAVNCYFNHDDSLVICGLKNRDILMLNTWNGSEFARIRTNYDIQSLLLVPGDQCTALILNKNYMSVCEICSASGGSKTQVKDVRSIKPINQKRDDSYLCASMSHDGRYFAVASTNCNTVICDVATGAIDSLFVETNGLTRSLAWSMDNHILMAAYDNKTLKFWNLKRNGTLRKSTRLKASVFDAVWLQDGDNSEYTIAAAVNTSNNIEILNSCVNITKEMIKPQNKTPIVCIAVSSLNGEVIYSCESGNVYLIDKDYLNVRLLFRVECEAVRALKVFVRNASLLITMKTLSAKTSQDCLTSWIQNEDDAYEGNSVNYGDGKDKIFDFFFHQKLDRLFTVLNNHAYRMYSVTNGMNIGGNEIDVFEAVTLCDFFEAALCWKICTGNEDCIILHNSHMNTPVTWSGFSENVDTPKPKMCKFSHDGNHLAVGCINGDILIMETVNNLNLLHIVNFKLKPVIDIMWNIADTWILTVLNHDIILSKAYSSDYESHLYLHVDKVVANSTFDTFVTVDSDGHFHIFNRCIR